MTNKKPDIEADTKAAKDRGEPISAMEPLLIGADSKHRAALTDLAVELAARSAGFRRSLPESLFGSLATLVRAMNCYYSNLIEGHDTHPIDIERALKDDYSQDAKKRDLQLEAKAHIAVQHWIDTGGLKAPATTTDAILEIHRRFCELLPERPHAAVALGAAAVAVGAGPTAAARVAALGAVTGPASAAVRLLGLDPLDVATLLARLADRVQDVADAALAAAEPGRALPAPTGPLLDLLAQAHVRSQVRLFAS